MTEVRLIELPERLDIACVEALHLEFEDALTGGQSLQLQGSKVVKLDTAGIQLLEAFYDEAQKHHLQIEWVETSNTITEVLNFLNLGPSVGLSNEEQEQVDE